MSNPRRRLASTCIGTVTAGILATGAALAAPDTEPQRSSTTAVGAYLHYGAPGVARIKELSSWLGGRELRVGHTYLPGDLWSNIEGRADFLDDWARWRKAKEDRLFVLNVPMQERNEAGVPDQEVARLIRAGADGRYDVHFKRLAERLVSLGIPDTVIVLGWEMNGITYTHRCGPDPENWKAYWKRIVTTMRSVPGQEFRFDFAPNRGTDAIGWTRCYPGDDVVDIIGMDSYDQAPGRSFDEHITQPFGLRDQVDFARAHGKQISYPEWGLFRHGDNPEYMRRMLGWIDQQKPLYHTITDYCPHGVWQCGQNPRSSQVFRELMSRPRPEPTVPPIPTPPVVPSPPVVPTPPAPTPVVPTPPVPSPVVPSPVPPSPSLPVPPVVPPVPTPPVPTPPVVEPPVTPKPSVPPVPPVTPKPSVPPVPPVTPKPSLPPVAPEPPAEPKPPVNDKEWCVPLDFDDWLSGLVGKQKVCVKIDWDEDFWPF
ncbi:glycosyl hydrolase [Streptomyces sp. NPDC097619]|uniref:glycoside hydrolase family 26 protein n=1 Tax=Streptomyces sp. NPDC097619 TaxID=3157228 RepID=UPI00331DB12E